MDGQNTEHGSYLGLITAALTVVALLLRKRGPIMQKTLVDQKVLGDVVELKVEVTPDAKLVASVSLDIKLMKDKAKAAVPGTLDDAALDLIFNAVFA